MRKGAQIWQGHFNTLVDDIDSVSRFSVNTRNLDRYEFVQDTNHFSLCPTPRSNWPLDYICNAHDINATKPTPLHYNNGQLKCKLNLNLDHNSNESIHTMAALNPELRQLAQFEMSAKNARPEFESASESES